MTKRFLSLLLCLVMCLSLLPAAFADAAEPPENGWYTDAAGKTYYYENGSPVRNTNKKIGDAWYVFDLTGVMQKDRVHVIYTQDGGSYYRAKADGKLYVNAWYKDTSGSVVYWYYYGEDGAAAHGFRRVGSHDYYFYYGGLMATNTVTTGDDGYAYIVDGNGYAVRLKKDGWTKYNGYWYYCENGRPVTGQVRKIGEYYYGFDYQGRMYTDTYGNCNVECAGEKVWYFSSYDWTDQTNYYYHASASGALFTNQWLKMGNLGWMYFGSDARALAGGRYAIGGKQYDFDDSGFSDGKVKGQAGWVKTDGKWYYFKNDGSKATGWEQIGGKWYYFSSAGVMQTGWVKSGSSWYYFGSSGAMVTGWQQIGGSWYYFKSSGAMVTGWQQIGGKWYYFQSSGAMKTGWLSYNGKWYYFESSGAMLADTSREIGGKVYHFNASGVCTNP